MILLIFKAGVAYIKEHEVNHLRINDASDVKYLFNFGEKLGKGSFGVVLKVQEKSTEKVWAMKILNRNKASLLFILLMRFVCSKDCSKVVRTGIYEHIDPAP